MFILLTEYIDSLFHDALFPNSCSICAPVGRIHTSMHWNCIYKSSMRHSVVYIIIPCVVLSVMTEEASRFFTMKFFLSAGVSGDRKTCSIVRKVIGVQ